MASPIVLRRILGEKVHALIKTNQLTYDHILAAVEALSNFTLDATDGQIMVGVIPTEKLSKEEGGSDAVRHHVASVSVDALFEGEGWKDFSPVIDELSVACNATTCRAYFDLIPRHLKLDALKWGMCDTVFRDAAYVFLKEKLKKD